MPGGRWRIRVWGPEKLSVCTRSGIVSPMRGPIPSATEFKLLTLVFHERTGREIAAEFRRAEGRDIPYGTLYSTLRRMKERGWVRVREEQDADGRLKFFKVTPAGARARHGLLEHMENRHAELAAFGDHEADSVEARSHGR